MKKIVTGVCALAVAVAVPAAAIGAQPSSTDKKNAAKTCKALRASAGRQNFANMFGGKRNAYGKCVSKQAKLNALQAQQAQTSAEKTCRQEQQANPSAFNTKYGTSQSNSNGNSQNQSSSNGNGANAFGKCVSQHARQNQQQNAQENKNTVSAAKTCKSQQSSNRAAFSQQWGTSRNAFGKCVSRTAHQLNQQGGQGQG